MSRNFLSSSFIFLFIFLFYLTDVHAQQKSTSKVKPKKTTAPKVDPKSKVKVAGTDEKSQLTKEETEEFKLKISRLVSFLEFALNIIGSDSSAAEDKEVIINSSYLKFFKDSKVQIEDDLVEGRQVVTFKSVQAYLHDVDYFFSNATFELSVDEINPYLADKNNGYFIVGVTRYLKGVTSDGDTVKNSKKRFVEINLGAKDKDLKIASIYSTKYNETKDLAEWWKGLPEGWKLIFRKEMGNTADTINYGQLKRILSTENLDISGNDSINTIEPLNKLEKLKTLNISKTKITDLTPLRNLTFLEVLDCSSTPITSLEKLKYTTELKELNLQGTSINSLEPVAAFTKIQLLNINQTPVNSLAPLSKLTSLTHLHSSAVPVTDLAPISNLNNLSILNISETEIQTLDALSKLEKLVSLNISSTKVSSIDPLATLKNLKELLINKTSINTLQPLKDIPGLEKIYCDGSAISKEEAKKFMQAKPGTLVIFESEGRMQWWNELGQEWKNVFRKYIPVKDVPTLEQLAAITNISEINLAGNKEIKSLQPLSAVSNLKILILNNTDVNTLDPIKDNLNIEILEISNTPITDIAIVHSFKKMKRINMDNTPVDQTLIRELREKNPECIVVYKTQALNSWWAGVPDEWRLVFKKHLVMEELPNTIQLHQLVTLDSIGIFNNNSIKTLDPLKEFESLKILQMFNTSVNNLDALGSNITLQKLGCSKSPVKSIQIVSKLTLLNYLDIDNTGVEDLEPLKDLKEIETLKFSGTPIDNLKEISTFEKLILLDCSSTGVNNLKPIEKLQNIRTLKCYNTRLSSKKVDNFKKMHPECEVVYY